MKKSRTGSGEAAKLRRQAEERLKERKASVAGEAGADPQRLLNELEVHQVELEMQNEELRAARQELETGFTRYAELFDFAPIGYFVIAGDGTVRETNLAAARLLGTERQRLVGRRFGLFVAEEQRPAFHRFFQRVLTKTAEDKGSESCDLTLAGEGTESLEVHLTAVAFQGSTPAALVAVEDVTARKRAEVALRAESCRKDEFLATLSHELRNPLAPIRNSLFLLERAQSGGEQARKAMAVIDRQVTHLTRIVDDLLDVARITRGKIQLQRESVELGELVRRTIDDHRPSFELNGLELAARFGGELFWVNADPTRLVQVLGNLLANAVKFTSRGGKVEVAVRAEGQKVAVSVADTGVGIPPEVHRHLFEPFRQAPQTLARTRGGLGLGLAMVKGLVELHGGTVDVVSAGPGSGSEFTVRLPLGAVPRVMPANAQHAGRRCRVLVIEDNVDSADSLRDALELGGHDVQVAYDGPAGLTRAREFRPEIVLCDIGLPGMNGYEVARAVRSDAVLKGSYLIALTGYALPEDLHEAMEAGFDRHVSKPPRLEKLEQLFAEALSRATWSCHGVGDEP